MRGTAGRGVGHDQRSLWKKRGIALAVTAPVRGTGCGVIKDVGDLSHTTARRPLLLVGLDYDHVLALVQRGRRVLLSEPRARRFRPRAFAHLLDRGHFFDGRVLVL